MTQRHGYHTFAFELEHLMYAWFGTRIQDDAEMGFGNRSIRAVDVMGWDGMGWEEPTWGSLTFAGRWTSRRTMNNAPIRVQRASLNDHHPV